MTNSYASAPAGAERTGGSDRKDARGRRPASRWAWDSVFAVLVLVLVGWRAKLPGGLVLGDCVALALLPMTWSAVRRSSRFAVLMVWSVFAAATGWGLSLWAMDERFSVIPAVQRSQLLLALALPAAVAAFVWGRERLGLEGAVLAMCAGVFLDNLNLLRTATNAWKLGLGTTVTIVVLTLAHRRGRGTQFLAALTLAGVYLVRDSRASTAMLVLLLAVLAWQTASKLLGTVAPTPGQLRGRQSLLLVALSGAAAVLVVAASLSGYLGESVQKRTIIQASHGGLNFILAARPELGATRALLSARPWGYGAGLQPRYEDVQIAMGGMVEIGYDPSNGYVRDYMFGHGFEVHSGLGDAWISLSLPGLVMVAYAVWLSLRGLWEHLGDFYLRSWLLFAVFSVLLNAAVGPLSILYPYLVLTTGTALCLLDHPGRDPSRPRRRKRAAARTSGASRRPSPQRSGQRRPSSATASARAYRENRDGDVAARRRPLDRHSGQRSGQRAGQHSGRRGGQHGGRPGDRSNDRPSGRESLAR